MVAPGQAWEKVTFAFKFWPFKMKMVKTTLSLIIKLTSSPFSLLLF